MKDTTALVVAFAVSFLVFIGAPNVPNWTLQMLVDTYVGVILLLVAVVVALKFNPLLALAAFLAAGALFLENRKRILIKIESPEVSVAKNAKGAPVSTLVEGSADLVDGEVHPEHEEPAREDHSFAPEKDASDEFNPVGESIDGKVPPEGADPHSIADHYTRSNGIPN